MFCYKKKHLETAMTTSLGFKSGTQSVSDRKGGVEKKKIIKREISE